jgi:hypothetical protein
MRFLPIALFLSVVATSTTAHGHQPDGSGNPTATSCMTGERPTGSQVPLRFCYTNAQWAELKAKHIAISPDGHPMLAADAPPGTQVIGPDGKPLLTANDPRNIHSRVCTRQYTGGPSSTMSPNFNEVCDNEH